MAYVPTRYTIVFQDPNLYLVSARGRRIQLPIGPDLLSLLRAGGSLPAAVTLHYQQPEIDHR